MWKELGYISYLSLYSISASADLKFADENGPYFLSAGEEVV